MPRTTYVKAAQQRYRTVPVLDENGVPKRTPVKARDGSQKVSKRGPVFMTVTQVDKSQPLPNRKCDKCGTEIKVGDPYKWIKPKSGPYGGQLRVRCGPCPNWQVWEYSSSLSARLSQVSFEFWGQVDDVNSQEEVTDALSSAAEAVREIASEKEEGAENIESGFGHETEQSQELRDVAEQLNGWADEIENADVPEFPEPEEVECEECDGTGELTGTGEDAESSECEECSGTGQVTPEEPTDEQLDAWRDEVRDNLSIVDESPV